MWLAVPDDFTNGHVQQMSQLNMICTIDTATSYEQDLAVKYIPQRHVKSITVNAVYCGTEAQSLTLSPYTDYNISGSIPY